MRPYEKPSKPTPVWRRCFEKAFRRCEKYLFRESAFVLTFCSDLLRHRNRMSDKKVAFFCRLFLKDQKSHIMQNFTLRMFSGNDLSAPQNPAEMKKVHPSLACSAF